MQIYYPFNSLSCKPVSLVFLSYTCGHKEYCMIAHVIYLYLFVSLNSYACYVAFLALNSVLSGNAACAYKTLSQNPCHLCPPYLPIYGIFLQLQIIFSCATFKIFKILLFVSLFLISWGSSRELVITCDKQGHFPPFHPVLMVYVLTWICRQRLKQNINIIIVQEIGNR